MESSTHLLRLFKERHGDWRGRHGPQTDRCVGSEVETLGTFRGCERASFSTFCGSMNRAPAKRSSKRCRSTSKREASNADDPYQRILSRPIESSLCKHRLPNATPLKVNRFPPLSSPSLQASPLLGHQKISCPGSRHHPARFLRCHRSRRMRWHSSAPCPRWTRRSPNCLRKSCMAAPRRPIRRGPA